MSSPGEEVASAFEEVASANEAVNKLTFILRISSNSFRATAEAPEKVIFF